MYKLLNKEDDDGNVIEDKYKKVEYNIRESYRNGKKEYCTNPQTKTNALIKAGFLCELNNSHKTFVVEKSRQYVEGHRIIPMCKQDNYENSVGVEDNIISLCPNCHREIHHTKDESSLSKKIFDLRKDYLKSKGIKTPSMLKDLYK